MAYGQPHTALAPSVGTAGPDYATSVNAAIAEIQATLAAKVTPAGMDLNSALSFLSGGTNYPITDLERLNMQNKGVAINAATYPRALYVVNGDLYFNDGAGNQVRLTNGGVLNVASVGGITGAGYGASGVEVNWDSAASAYRFKTGAGADAYGALVCDDLLLRDGSSHAWRLRSPALAADLNLDLPSAYPSASRPVVMSSAGVLSTPEVPPHGEVAIVVPPIGTGTPAAGITYNQGSISISNTADSQTAFFPIYGLRANDRIRELSVFFNFTAAGTSEVITVNLTLNGATLGVSGATVGGTDQTVTIDFGAGHIVAANAVYGILLTVGGPGWDRACIVETASVTVDRA